MIFKRSSSTKVIKITTLYSMLCIMCIAVHIALTLVFGFSEMMPLTLLNIISVFIYILLLYMIRNKQFDFATIICCIEISFNAFASSIMLSWDYGFYYYFFALIPLSFYCKFKNNITKFVTSGYIFLSFIITYLISNNVDNYYKLKPSTENFIYMMNACCCFAVLIFLSYLYTKTIIYETKLLSESNVTLQKLANTDPLTALLNRRSMMEKLSIAAEKKSASGFIYSLIMIDIDDFKKINDCYGHDGGDVVLQKISKLIRATIRKNDIVCRWGGEEILILLPNTYSNEAEVVAEKLRLSTMSENFLYNEKLIKVTITLGISCSIDCEDIPQLINKADMCLYRGKQRGKNCVITTLNE